MFCSVIKTTMIKSLEWTYGCSFLNISDSSICKSMDISSEVKTYWDQAGDTTSHTSKWLRPSSTITLITMGKWKNNISKIRKLILHRLGISNSSFRLRGKLSLMVCRLWFWIRKVRNRPNRMPWKHLQGSWPHLKRISIGRKSLNSSRNCQEKKNKPRNRLTSSW